jgi:hypothetical protein
MRKLLTATALSFLFLSSAMPTWSAPANKSVVIKVLRVTSERACVPQLPGELDTGVLCGEGLRVVAESKEFYIEAVSLAAMREIQPMPSVGEYFAAILPGNFLSILDTGDAEKAKIVSSFNIEVLKPKQEIRGEK